MPMLMEAASTGPVYSTARARQTADRCGALQRFCRLGRPEGSRLSRPLPSSGLVLRPAPRRTRTEPSDVNAHWHGGDPFSQRLEAIRLCHSCRRGATRRHARRSTALGTSAGMLRGGQRSGRMRVVGRHLAEDSRRRTRSSPGTALWLAAAGWLSGTGRSGCSAEYLLGQVSSEQTFWFVSGLAARSTSRTASSASSPSPTPSTTPGRLSEEVRWLTSFTTMPNTPRPWPSWTRSWTRLPLPGRRRRTSSRLLALVIEMYEKHRWPFELPDPVDAILSSWTSAASRGVTWRNIWAAARAFRRCWRASAD